MAKEDKDEAEKAEKPNSPKEEKGQEGERELVVKVENLSKAFGGKKILDGLTVDLYKGENLVVMGKSGSGKSVLIKCIVRLIEPDSGIIEVFGKNMEDLNNRELDEMRLRTGFLFQSAALYDSMSVRENMEFPLVRQNPSLDKKEKDQRVKEMLDSVGLLHAIDKMPSELSGGMRKRAGLARTLILKPAIMLYDEPTTGLDTTTSHEISDLINKVRDEFGVSSIIITHDLACAETTGDSIMVLKDGKNFQEGSYQELFDSKDDFVHGLFH